MRQWNLESGMGGGYWSLQLTQQGSHSICGSFPFEPVRQAESVICQTDHIKCYIAEVSDDIENDLLTWKW